MPATPRALNFKYVSDVVPEGINGHVTNEKQIRARRRRAMKGLKKISDVSEDLALELDIKPIEEWDFEELARGRPRNKDGTFRGRKPSYISRELHEKIMDRFKLMVKQKMVGNGIDAMNALDYLLNNEDMAKGGRPLVPPTVRLQAATYVMDHLIGRPTQPVQTDVSVKLQGILGMAMVNPTDDGGFQLAQRGSIQQAALPGEIIVEEEDEDDDDDGE